MQYRGNLALVFFPVIPPLATGNAHFLITQSPDSRRVAAEPEA